MINIICALKHEARPIIDHFQLVHDGSATAFTTYRGKNEDISLTITGVGKNAAAKGTRYAIDHYKPDISGAWLNIGIAGHKRLAPGTPVLAGRITDAASGQVWHPNISFAVDLETLPLVTVDQPQEDYPDDEMIDMEASGFYGSACRTGSRDLVHCLKIISDNTLNPPRNISKRTIFELVFENIAVIERLLCQLRNYSEKSTPALS